MTGDEAKSGLKRKPWRFAPWISAGALWLSPAAAMQVTAEVAWDAADFAAFGALLFGGCAAYDLLARSTGPAARRVAAGAGVVAAVLLVWAELAVGIVGPG